MHHQGQVTTEVGGDHFRSTGVKLWAAVTSAYLKVIRGVVIVLQKIKPYENKVESIKEIWKKVY